MKNEAKSHPSVVAKILAQATSFPTNTALSGSSGDLTYRELSQLAQHVKMLLQSLSVRAGEVIAIEMANASAAITAMLGVAMANAIWVIVDPRLPLARRRQILDDAAPVLVLAEGGEDLSIDSVPGWQYVQVFPRQLNAIAASGCPADRSAYILYTSGSTGKPKGVVQTHGNLSEHIAEYVTRIGLNVQDHVALLAPLDTDAALMDIFGSLCSGACVHPYELRELGLSPLLEWLDEHRITVLHATPTVFRALVGGFRASSALPPISRVVFGGEMATWDDVRRAREAWGAAVTVFNGYGPTECTMATQAKFEPGVALGTGTLPVGHGVTNVDFIVTGATAHPESEGEIIIVSSRVAEGYWRMPEETRRSFINDPRGQKVRAYRTGDRGKRLLDGTLVITGRVDEQIKLRGHRIEPHEVEAALQIAARVRYACVNVVELELGPQLVAALVPDDLRADFDDQMLTSQLAELLPHYMIPARFLLLAEMPLTRSGKIDRRGALSLMQALVGQSEHQGHYFADTPVTETLRSTWRAVLGVEARSGKDNLFALGGDSLAAIRLAATIESTFRINISPKDIFQHRHFDQLAHLIAARITSRDVPQQPAPTENRMVFSELTDFVATPSGEQVQMFLSTSIVEGSPNIEIAHALELTGLVDAVCLQKALSAVSNRYEALRATIAVGDDGAPMRILANSIFLCEIDDSFGPGRLQLAERARWHMNLLREKLLLTKAPIVVSLVRIGDGRALLLVVGNHLVLDGLSLRMVMREVVSQYASAKQQQQDARWIGSPAPYSTYIMEQQRWRRSPRYKESLEWWKRQLSGSQPLDLASSVSVGGKPTGVAGRHTFSVDADLCNDIHKRLDGRQLTIHSAFLAAFALLLSNYCRRQDICIAVPASNRTGHKYIDAVGLFVNTVVLRLVVEADKRALEFVETATEATFDALNHQHVLIADVISHLGLSGRLTNPFTEAMLVVQSFGPLEFETGEVRSKDIPIAPTKLTSLLCLNVDTLDQRIVCHFDYDSGVFEPSMIEEMSSHLLQVLRELSNNDEVPLSKIQLLSPTEVLGLTSLHQFVDEGYEGTSICTQFETQANLTPDKPAVVFGKSKYTYDQVNRAASALARRIIVSSPVRGQLIPVITNRRESLAVLLFAVLKSGNAFVPIDADWPTTRIQKALKQCDAQVVIVDSDLRNSDYIGAHLALSLETTDYHYPSPSWEDASPTQPDDPIYGIFTSGSTGEPKLPLIPHRGISNRFAWMTATFVADSPPVTLATTPHIYDSAVWQYLWPLTCGGRVVVPVEWPVLTADSLIDVVSEHRVTIADFVPSLFDRIVDQLERRPEATTRMQCLDYLILGGEALRIATVRRFKEIAPTTCVVNLYGPTEASIGCIFNVVDTSLETQPIGKPIPNCRALILGDDGRLLPRGVVGHLYLAGACVGLGYVGNPVATATSFVRNRFTLSAAAQTLYRTGDLGRLSADGNIFYVGRSDTQVKLRGVRIDPAEIEEVIASEKGVVAVAVDVCSDADGAKRLVAWIAPSAPPSLRALCLEHLPISLVPEFFVDMPSLPLTPAGKLDRKSLRSTVLSFLPSPTEPLGDALASSHSRVGEIWANVLSVPSVPLNRSFFELGGNSLLAIQLASKLSVFFGRKITVVDIFRYPTIADFTRRF